MSNESQLEQMMQALSAFINAKTWLESKEIVQQAENLLLTDEAEVALLTLQAQHAKDEQLAAMLMEHSMLLRHCREQGIEAAFGQKLHSDVLPDVSPELMQRAMEIESEKELAQLLQEHPELVPILQAAQQMPAQSEVEPRLELVDKLETLMEFDTWEESRRYLHQHSELVSENALYIMRLLIEEAEEQEDEDAARIFRDYHELLLRACEQGIDAAVGERMASTAQMPPITLIKLLQAFVTSDNWLEARQLVEENPSLLSAEADALLEQWIAKAERQSEQDLIQHLQAHRERLARAREEGLDAIAPAMSAEKFSLLQQLASLPEAAREVFFSLMQNELTAEALQVALQEHPELMPVLVQMMDPS